MSFTNSDQKLILYDPKKRSFVILNNEGYMFGRKFDSMILLDEGGWINLPETSLFIHTKKCPFVHKIDG